MAHWLGCAKIHFPNGNRKILETPYHFKFLTFKFLTNPSQHTSATHHDPRTTAGLEKAKYGREIARIKAIILVLRAGR